MRHLLAILLVFGLMTVNAQAHCGACAPEKPHGHSSEVSAESKMSSIIETAKDAGSFKTLLAAVEAAELDGALSGDGPFTVFAPTDEAFAALPAGTVESLLKDKEKLASILSYHVLVGAVMASDVAGINKAETLNGQSVAVSVTDEMVMVNQARVISTDIECSNGVIHAIDAVMLPKPAKSEG